MMTFAQQIWRNSTLMNPARYAWRKFYWSLHSWREKLKEPPLRKRERRETRRDLRQLRISRETVDCLEHAKRCARQISGDNWDYYSGTLYPQHAAVFEQVISVLPSNGEVVHYLEMGSASGASMSLVATLLKRSHPNFRLVSIDPYYANGYVEGERAVKATRPSKASMNAGALEVGRKGSCADSLPIFKSALTVVRMLSFNKIASVVI